MCFSENQSYIHTIILLIGSYYSQSKWRLALPLLFLSSKDFLQGLLYRYQGKVKIENILASLSWIHICFQPLFVNMVMSHFDQDNFQYWNAIFIICIVYGLYTVTTLKEFDIQNDPNCTQKHIKDDFCSETTSSYIGKYHIAYQFNRDNDKLFFPNIYYILLIVPCLFTKARILSLIWGIYIIAIERIFRNQGFGEIGAIWCFLSVFLVLPFSIFENYVHHLFII